MKPAVLRNIAIILALVGVMLAIKLFDLIMEPNHVFPGRSAAFPWVELLLATGAGVIGAVLAARTEIVAVLPARGARPLAGAFGLGLALGVGLALIDAWLRIGDISVGLPLAPLFYLWGGISQEMLTHFAPAAIVVGIASFALPGARAQTVVFWIVAVVMSALAAAGMMAAFQNPDIPLSARVAAAPYVIGGAVLAIELAVFAMLGRNGFLASLAMRLGFYTVWHIAWPVLAY